MWRWQCRSSRSTHRERHTLWATLESAFWTLCSVENHFCFLFWHSIFVLLVLRLFSLFISLSVPLYPFPLCSSSSISLPHRINFKLFVMLQCGAWWLKRFLYIYVCVCACVCHFLMNLLFIIVALTKWIAKKTGLLVDNVVVVAVAAAVFSTWWFEHWSEVN